VTDCAKRNTPMRLTWLAALLAMGLIGRAEAQTGYIRVLNCGDYKPATGSVQGSIDQNGNICMSGSGAGAASPTFVLQGGRTPVAGAQYGLGVAISTALTVPATATIAEITVEGAPIRYTTDGATAPTSTVGMGPFPIGTTLVFNLVSLAGIRIIQTAATATVDVEYFK